MNTPPWTIEALGEDAVLLRLGACVELQLNRQVHALAARVSAARPPWLRDIVPAYAALALHIDPTHPLAGDRFALDLVHDFLATLPVEELHAPGCGVVASLEIPVCHDPACAPDLDAVASRAGLARDALIARHCAPEYTVGMIGFAPGFPYLLGLDPALATPRHATPRTRVPAGSVGIGGSQTGIYPAGSPGGWQIIGRTPTVLFDPHRAAPSLLQPGQRLRFVPITLAEYTAMAAAADRARG